MYSQTAVSSTRSTAREARIHIFSGARGPLQLTRKGEKEQWVRVLAKGCYPVCGLASHLAGHIYNRPSETYQCLDVSVQTIIDNDIQGSKKYWKGQSTIGALYIVAGGTLVYRGGTALVSGR